MSYLNALGHLEHSALRYELLLVRREAHDGPRVEVEHARQRETGLRKVGDRAHVVVDARHFVFRFRFSRWLTGLLLSIGRWLRALFLATGLAPRHGSVIAEGVLEALAGHRTVVVGPSNALAAHWIWSHASPPWISRRYQQAQQSRDHAFSYCGSRDRSRVRHRRFNELFGGRTRLIHGLSRWKLPHSGRSAHSAARRPSGLLTCGASGTQSTVNRADSNTMSSGRDEIRWRPATGTPGLRSRGALRHRLLCAGQCRRCPNPDAGTTRRPRRSLLSPHVRELRGTHRLRGRGGRDPKGLGRSSRRARAAGRRRH